jgi:hypothetical protein
MTSKGEFASGSGTPRTTSLGALFAPPNLFCPALRRIHEDARTAAGPGNVQQTRAMPQSPRKPKPTARNCDANRGATASHEASLRRRGEPGDQEANPRTTSESGLAIPCARRDAQAGRGRIGPRTRRASAADCKPLPQAPSRASANWRSSPQPGQANRDSGSPHSPAFALAQAPSGELTSLELAKLPRQRAASRELPEAASGKPRATRSSERQAASYQKQRAASREATRRQPPFSFPC